MKKILRMWLALVAAGLLACTDYVADIDDAHDAKRAEREKNGGMRNESSDDVLIFLSSSSVEHGTSARVCQSSLRNIHFGSGDLWNGSEYLEGMQVSREDGSYVYLYWFEYSDRNYGMESFINWPVALGTEYSPISMQPVIDECSGLCGGVSFSQGKGDLVPFVGVSIHSENPQDHMDLSSWGGLCVGYASTIPIKVLLGVDNWENDLQNGNRPFVELPRSSGASICHKWSDFKQVSYADQQISGETASQHIVYISFEMMGDEANQGEFFISSLGTYH